MYQDFDINIKQKKLFLKQQISKLEWFLKDHLLYLKEPYYNYFIHDVMTKINSSN